MRPDDESFSPLSNCKLLKILHLTLGSASLTSLLEHMAVVELHITTARQDDATGRMRQGCPRKEIDEILTRIPRLKVFVDGTWQRVSAAAADSL